MSDCRVPSHPPTHRYGIEESTTWIGITYDSQQQIANASNTQNLRLPSGQGQGSDKEEEPSKRQVKTPEEVNGSIFNTLKPSVTSELNSGGHPSRRRKAKQSCANNGDDFQHKLSYSVTKYTPLSLSDRIDTSSVVGNSSNTSLYSYSNTNWLTNTSYDLHGIGHWAEEHPSQTHMGTCTQPTVHADLPSIAPGPKILEALRIFDMQFLDYSDKVSLEM